MNLKSLFCCALIVIGAQNSRAAEQVEFKPSGDFRARYFNDLDATGVSGADGQQADSTARLRYNLNARKGETLQAFSSVIFRTEFGAENSPNGTFLQTANQNLLLVNRAWGWWKATNSLALKVGRFGVEIADGAVFSENEWEDIPTAQEGAQLIWDTDVFKLDAYAIKTNEFTLANQVAGVASGPVVGAPNNDPERNFYLLSANLKNLPDAIKIANLHFVQTIADGIHNNVASRGKESWEHVGLTLAGEAAHIIYKFTTAFQAGQLGLDQPASTTATTTGFNANMFDVLLGYSLPETLGLKFTLGFHRDTGNTIGTKQNQYQTLYYNRHDYAGIMDLIGWGNLTYWDFNASMQLREDFDIGLGYYFFSRTESGAYAVTNFGERYSLLAADFNGVDVTQRNLGSEFDLYAERTFEANFKLSVQGSVFAPGNLMKAVPSKVNQAVHNQLLSQLMVQGSMTF